MRILIDHSNLIVGGGIQVGTSYLNDLRNIESNHEFFIIQSYNSKNSIDKSLFPSNFSFYDLDESALYSIFKRRKMVVALELKYSPDIIFVTFGPSYHKSKFPKIVGFAIPYLIYPDSPFFRLISMFERLKYKLLGAIKKRAFIKYSDALIFETENAREVFSKFLNKEMKTFTVNNTLNEIFFDKNRWNSIAIDTKSSFRILCLTANYKHKNLAIIPDIIDELLSKFDFKDFKFVISASENELLFESKYGNFIEYLGKVPLDQVPDLYCKVDLSFQPTLLEVFSTTYLEAMFMKKPIIASNMPFARDICADAAIYCNPSSASEYAKAIYQLRNDEQLREVLIEKGQINFNRFGKSIDRTECYLNIINEIKAK